MTKSLHIMDDRCGVDQFIVLDKLRDLSITGCQNTMKTRLLKHLIKQLPSTYSARVIIFETLPEYSSGEYKCDVDEVINLTDNSVYINPFIKLTNDESNEEIAYRVANTIAKYGNLGSDEYELVDIILEGLDNCELFTFYDLVKKLDDYSEVNKTKRKLFDIVRHIGVAHHLMRKGNMQINCTTNTPGTTIIKLHNRVSGIKPLFMEFLLNSIYHNCDYNYSKTPVVLVLDDYYKYIDSAKYMNSLYNIKKSMNIFIWACSHETGDFKDNIFINGSIRIFFKPTLNDYNRIPNYLGYNNSRRMRDYK